MRALNCFWRDGIDRILEVTSRELKNFQMGLKTFGEIENFSSVVVETFS